MLMAEKCRLLGLPQPQRRMELVSLYLCQSSISDGYLGTRAARLLRLEAMGSDPQPVCAGFSRAIDAAAERLGGRAGFAIVRATQAVFYLQGKLPQRQCALYQTASGGAVSFLSDDLPAPIGGASHSVLED